MTGEVPLSRGFVAVVDGEDLAAVLAAGPWHCNTRGRTTYGQRNVRKRGGGWTTEGLHQFITGLRWIDHVNGDGLDNRRVNLRPATAGQNAANRRLRSDATSGFKGVTANKVRGKPWRADITIAYTTHYLGLFDTAEEAAHAYDAAAAEAWGEFARPNFPAGATA